MYKADKKRYEFGEEMESLAKSLLMDIVEHRIEAGNMDETDDGEYSILTADYSGDYSVNVYVSNPYGSEESVEKQGVESVYLGSQIYLGLASGEEVYFHSLPLESMVNVCIMLEDFLDEEESKGGKQVKEDLDAWYHGLDTTQLSKIFNWESHWDVYDFIDNCDDWWKDASAADREWLYKKYKEL